MKFDTSNLKFTTGGIEYIWFGGYGCIFYSYEQGVKINDIRMIGGVIFYAYMVERSGWYRKIYWVPQEDINNDWIRRCKANIFSYDC